MKATCDKSSFTYLFNTVAAFGPVEKIKNKNKKLQTDRNKNKNDTTHLVKQ